MPKISQVPNPCKVIAERLKLLHQEKFSEAGKSEKALREALKEFDDMRVKEIVNKEWEKVQKLAYIGSTAFRDEQDQ
jgi:acetyl-CoA carboxylase alpha subunit